ncbi:MAG: hypothetical protein R3C05_27425 [Pirellulaceae bacterium]
MLLSSIDPEDGELVSLAIVLVREAQRTGRIPELRELVEQELFTRGRSIGLASTAP